MLSAQSMNIRWGSKYFSEGIWPPKLHNIVSNHLRRCDWIPRDIDQLIGLVKCGLVLSEHKFMCEPQKRNRSTHTEHSPVSRSLSSSSVGD